MVTTVRTATIVPRNTTNERLSALLVVLITMAALIGGLLLRNSVEGATRSFATPYNLTIAYPDGWRIDSSDPNRVIVREAGSGRFPTTFEVASILVDASAPVSQVLGTVSQGLAAGRGTDLTAYKVLDIQTVEVRNGEQVQVNNAPVPLMIKGLPAIKTRYAYVTTPSSVFTEGLPTVVVGTDYLIHKGDRVYVFTAQSTEDNEADALARFDQFVLDARLP